MIYDYEMNKIRRPLTAQERELAKIWFRNIMYEPNEKRKEPEKEDN